ncbi:MAG TPA: SO2930 family diheme c-type cytochrome [Vitreimonas sp.]|uniref:SO2930 family diheme c-type cytochrome n=1 Tax=Vitreimonas sp. TaxID=3069702 RepID=UPI002D4A1103|nr:SO2930 family diheme c-type cytochrome [Vitreimonas sp.]HYD89044.1 SO2930 family diheme c-type cytochrome [Vitreimonas sp.]
MRFGLTILACLALVTSAAAQRMPPPNVDDRVVMAETPAPLLSHYRFFRDVRMTQPNPRVTPYELNTALYSDGALKFRHVYIPSGSQARYSADDVFDFPVGTVLIKTFAFAADMRAPTENVRFIETRLLIRREEGWVAYPYVWNEEQTEARYSPIGADVPVSFTDEDGEAIALDWAVPNRNQCKACHDRAGEFVPIGPSARNLNRYLYYPRRSIGSMVLESEAEDQLNYWLSNGLLDQVPDDVPYVPHAFDPEDGTIGQRARAYLDVNCAHCHNPEGPGHTSGLDLRWSQSDPALWGVGKRPVAAGRASGGFDFAIEPGHPERSILVHRMASTDPGVMMPELGRTLVDERGVALMREWIGAMREDGSSD